MSGVYISVYICPMQDQDTKILLRMPVRLREELKQQAVADGMKHLTPYILHILSRHAKRTARKAANVPSQSV
jgi:predicted DNA binding CopG/RHH family protein